MDWIQRRQIDARPFLRSTKFWFRHNWNSNSVEFGASERGKRHEFDVRDIHGTATGNLFFLLYGTGVFSSFIILYLVRSFSLFERGSNRDGLCWRDKHPWSIKSVDSPVDTELEKWRPSLGGDLVHFTSGVFVWRQPTLQPFYGFHVGGGNCGLTLMILFSLSDKFSLIIIEKKIIL